MWFPCYAVHDFGAHIASVLCIGEVGMNTSVLYRNTFTRLECSPLEVVHAVRYSVHTVL